MNEKVLFAGYGNVGYHLTRALVRSNYSVVVLVRNVSHIPNAEKKEANGSGILLTDDPHQLPSDFKMVFLPVQDDKILQAVGKIPQSIKENACLIHTSGIKPWDLLRGDCNHYGIFYPLNSFSKEMDFQWNEVPCFIKTNQESSQSKLFRLAEMLKARGIENSDAIRENLHLAAVFLNNFTNHMLVKAGDLLKENDIPLDYLHPLLITTVKKALQSDPRKVQTGPAVRGDLMTIEKHLNMLNDKTNKELYRIISESINPGLKNLI